MTNPEQERKVNIIPPQYEGLPSEVVEELWQGPRYVDEEKNISEKNRREAALAEIKRQEKLDTVRQELGLPPQPKSAQATEQINQSETKEIMPESKNEKALAELAQLLSERVEKLSPEKQEVFKKSYADILDNLREEDDENKIAGLLMSELSAKKRTSDYKPDPNYGLAWQYVNQNKDVPSRAEQDWMYRGVFPSTTEGTKTETRGSLNVNVTPELIQALDDLIKRGVIKANYKFGDPASGASGLDRHDAITIYFLEQPNQEALAAISDIAKKHLRGDNLIGNKISEGFYMSNIGSVADKHAKELIDQVAKVNDKLGKAVKGFLTGALTGKGEPRVAMSEAQFYSVKEALNAYGYDIEYDGQKGFTLKQPQE